MNCKDCGEPKKLRNIKGNSWRVACACIHLYEFEPKERATIIVPAKHQDIFVDCQASLDKFAPKENKILVRDSGDVIIPPAPWKTIQGVEPFVYSRNINLGIQESTGDVLLTNDDVRFTHPRTLEVMQAVMDKYPEVGILSPLIKGDVGCYAQGHCTSTLEYTTVRLCFVCVLIRREVLDKIGLMDESIGAAGGYGYDDCDMCRRVVAAGYKMAVTDKATVRHGDGIQHRSMSYNQVGRSFEAMDKIAQEQYLQKWGDLSLEFK